MIVYACITGEKSFLRVELWRYETLDSDSTTADAFSA